MKEAEFLERFAKILGATDKLREIEERQQREKRMLASLGAHLGVVVESVEEDRDVPQSLIQQPIIEEVPAPVTEPEVVEVITENVIPPLPELPVDTIVTKSVEMISKAVDTQAAVDTVSDPLRKELDAIKKSIADFHRFATRHSQMGGGGAGDVVNLDFQTTVVTGDYTVGRKDYYIGVNHTTNCVITLPLVGVKQGRKLVIKDEIGNAGFYPITVSGEVDNDPDGFILNVKYGAIQMIYRDGWRII